jgi:hypothetical protein
MWSLFNDGNNLGSYFMDYILLEEKYTECNLGHDCLKNESTLYILFEHKLTYNNSFIYNLN